jgi:outer membrane lipoprotein-sorting protein
MLKAIAATLLFVTAGSAIALAAESLPSTDSTLCAAVALAAESLPSTDSSLCVAVAAPSDPALDDLLARMDARAKEIKTIEADISITNKENFSGRQSVRSGKVYVRKPDDLLLDLAKPYPRKIWITAKEIVDYRSDLNTGDRITLASDDAGNRPQVIGLSTTAAELRRDFTLTLAPPAEKPARYVLTLVPKEGVKMDFTSADLTIDAKTLLPVSIVQFDKDSDDSKTFTLTNVKENPRLSGALFTPKFAPNPEIESHEPADWKGP